MLLAFINDLQLEFDLIPENVVMCLMEEMKDMRQSMGLFQRLSETGMGSQNQKRSVTGLFILKEYSL